MTDAQSTSQWQPEDLVYVDPDSNAVVGKVEWSNSGAPKQLPFVFTAPADPKAERRRSWRKYHPWGTYRAMKNVYKVDGKPHKKEPTKTLEQVIDVALKEPYWD